MITTILKPIKAQTNKLMVTKQPAWDERWYGELEKIGLLQANRLLEGNSKFREQQKKEFMAGLTLNPVLGYPLLDPNEVKLKIKQYTELKEKILAEEKEDFIKNAYSHKLDELMAKGSLLLATYNLSLQRKSNKKEQKKWRQVFKIATEHVYGAPKKIIFEWVVSNIREELRQYQNSGDKSFNDAINLLLAILPKIDDKINLFQAPSDEALTHIKKKFVGRMIDLDFDFNNDYLYQAEEIKDIFIEVLDKYDLNDWKVLLSPNILAISVDQDNKKIRIPKKRKAYASKIYKLIIHEIGTHIFRRTNGENSKLKLLGIGLSGYERGEEGIATIGEQLVYKSSLRFPFSKQISYLSIGLAYGLDGQKRDFRQVYNILEKLHYVQIKKLSTAAGKSEAHIVKKARDKAWSRCVRTFRGTNCDIPGLCYTKDIIYLEGKLCVWNLINNDSAEIDRFYVGKYDPCNPGHVKILDKLDL